MARTAENNAGYEVGLCHAYTMIINELERTKNETARKALDLVAAKLENRSLKLFHRGLHIVNIPQDRTY